MNYIILIFKTIIIYLIVAIVFRIMGKREVGQLGTFDLVVFLLIAELVAMALDKNNNFIYSILPVFVIVIMQLFSAKASLKSANFRRMIDGKPIIIIKKGVVNFKNMIDQKYNLDDLLLQLRQKDVRSIDEVDYAILENNGKLSVFKKDDKDNKVMPLPIILDGEVQYNNLYLINKTKKWLLNILIKKNISAKDVFYAFSKAGELYIITYNELEK